MLARNGLGASSPPARLATARRLASGQGSGGVERSSPRAVRAAQLFVLAAVIAIAAVAPAYGETVHGVLRYEVINSATGSPHMRPIAHAKLEIWQCVPGFLGTASGATDELPNV